MAKIHPGALASSSSSSSSSASVYFTRKQESFTIWMKSLILNGRGCTVFDSAGQIVYRVDNYDCKHSNRVFLMDSAGTVLFTILRKKLRRPFFKLWEGHRWSEFVQQDEKTNNPAFHLTKQSTIFTRGCSPYQVAVGLEKNLQVVNQYKIQSCTTSCKKSSSSSTNYNIVDNLGGIIAQVQRKQSSSGVVLGEDVLEMVVEPQVDHSLIMALIVALSLINSKI